jgi:hypothetical protein
LKNSYIYPELHSSLYRITIYVKHRCYLEEYYEYFFLAKMDAAVLTPLPFIAAIFCSSL